MTSQMLAANVWPKEFYRMRSDVVPGGVFPDYELTDP
jgi:hypothetical protein